MKKLLALLLFTGAIALWAADVWVAKPFTEWSEKDVQKIMTDSPFARHVTASFAGGFGGGAPGGGGGGGSKGGGKGGGGGFSGGGDSVDPGVDGGGGGGGGGGGRGGRGGGGGGPDIPSVGGAPETDLYIRWQSATTIAEALVKAQYGAEAGTSEEAKKKLEPQDRYYIIWVAGLPAYLQPRDEVAKKALLTATTLTIKDKPPITAVEVQYPPAGRGRTADAHFLFPKMTPITEADKEVEFATKFGKTGVKAKFTLKAMMVNGKLGL